MSMDQSPNAKRIRVCSALLLLTEQDDMVLLIFGSLDFPTLIRIQRVCKYWKQIVDQLLPCILGQRKFKTREELCEKIRQFCHKKHKFADELARTWPIGKWNVSLITNFEDAFYEQHDFNKDISEWDMSNATSLEWMFYEARSFNQELTKWNTSKVTSTLCMFAYAISFNGDVSTWDTSKVTTMYRMFTGAKSFNGDISKWNTSQVTSMHCMFKNAKLFNQDISSWNFTIVTNHNGMLEDAESFDERHAPDFNL